MFGHLLMSRQLLLSVPYPDIVGVIVSPESVSSSRTVGVLCCYSISI